MISLEFAVTIMVMFGYIFVFFLFYYFSIRPRRKRKMMIKYTFFKVLKEGLKTDAITTINDVVNIYKGIAGLGSEDLDYRYGLSRQLREFLVELLSKNTYEFLGDEKIDSKILKEWKERISEFIKRNEEVSPYSDLPPSERNILSDISVFLEKNDTEAVMRKSLELAGMLQARYNDLKKVRDVNKWSVPLSIIGVILTIAFGFLALIR